MDTHSSAQIQVFVPLLNFLIGFKIAFDIWRFIILWKKWRNSILHNVIDYLKENQSRKCMQKAMLIIKKQTTAKN